MHDLSLSCCRLQTAHTQASLKSTWGSIDQSPSMAWTRQPQRVRPSRSATASKLRRRSRKLQTLSIQRRERPSIYQATVWSSSTSALKPPQERSSRACWRSSWCWTIHASLRCTGRRTATDRVRTTHVQPLARVVSRKVTGDINTMFFFLQTSSRSFLSLTTLFF